MNDLLLIKLMAELKQTQCELLAAQKNRGEWKREAKKLMEARR